MSTDALGAAALDRATGQVAAAFPDRPDLVSTFDAALRNSLETTVRPAADGSTFVVTGDIPAMWLRDSAAQVEPYLRFAAEDPQLRAMLAGVVARHAAQIGIDPYANAFNESDSGARTHDDRPAQGPWVWERKYELDSLCYPDPARAHPVAAHRLGRPPRSGACTRCCVRSSPCCAPNSGTRPTRRTGSNGWHRVCRRPRRCPATASAHSRRRPGWCGRDSGRAMTPAPTATSIPANMFAVVEPRSARRDRPHCLRRRVTGHRRRGAGGPEIRQAIDEHGIVEHPRHGRDLGLRGRRPRQPAADGRRQRAEPALRAVPRLLPRRTTRPTCAPVRWC